MQPSPLAARNEAQVRSTVRRAVLGVIAVAAAAAVTGRWLQKRRNAPQGLAAMPMDVAASRLLRFEDRGDGAIRVIDASDGRVLEVLQGEQGFVRGTLRGFARERRRRDLPIEPPLVLALTHESQLMLSDPTTSHRVHLGAFGPDNQAAFARWMQPIAPTNSRAAPSTLTLQPVGRQP
jgi:putative photosynthetic complex assembly protein